MRALLVGLFVVSNAHAQETGKWLLRAGAHPVQPQSHGDSVLRSGGGTAISWSTTYMASEHWGVELFVTLPVEHGVYEQGVGKIGTADLKPSVLSIQYHFVDIGSRARAYLGVGLKYASISSDADDFTFESSYSGAFAVGLDIDVGPDWFLNLYARCLDIDTSPTSNGSRYSDLEIDPCAVGLALGLRF